MCQRSILLRGAGLLDLGFTAKYYALKINRFLFWNARDLAAYHKSPPGSESLSEFDEHPSLKAYGLFGEERIMEIEWEESVNLVWLLSERPHHDFADPFTDGVLSALGQGLIHSSRESSFSFRCLSALSSGLFPLLSHLHTHTHLQCPLSNMLMSRNVTQSWFFTPFQRFLG